MNNGSRCEVPVAVMWRLPLLHLGQLGTRMPVNDSWIAAAAIALGDPVVTHDRDYADIPGLDVVRV